MDADPDAYVATTLDPLNVSEVDQGSYAVLSNHAAKGVAVVSTVSRGRDYAVTVTDYLSVSYDPPTMVVSIFALSRMADALETSDRWALSILSAGQTAIADWLGEPGAPLIGLLDPVPHFRRDATAPALVSGALAWFELRTSAAHPAATHTLFVGDVRWMARPVAQASGPLVRYRSGYNRF